MSNTPINTDEHSINSEGGAVVGGDVKVDGGDFIGRDKNVFIFEGIVPLIRFLVAVTVALGVAVYVYWRLQQPAVMDGDFNIAVATLDQSSISDSPAYGEIIGKQLANFLNGEYLTSDFGNVQVTHKNIGVVADAGQAEKLAKKVNADLVVFGHILASEKKVTLSPVFFVRHPLYRVDISDLNGEHTFTYPIVFKPDELLAWDSTSNAILRQKVVVISEFLKGLRYLFLEDIERAQSAFDSAIQYAENDNFEGKEVLFIFASRSALLAGNYEKAHRYVDEALTLNPAYARAYIAKANIFYLQGSFLESYLFYFDATQATDQPYGSFIIEKAYLGLGNLHLDSFLSGTAPADQIQEAKRYYQLVIDLFTQEQNPNPYLRELTANAYFHLGRAYTAEDAPEKAREAYNLALQLTEDSRLQSQIEEHLIR